MIRVDAVWLSTEPLDMRSGAESALTRVVNVCGAARPHHAYLFATTDGWHSRSSTSSATESTRQADRNETSSFDGPLRG